jgi:hypothetical protein
VNAEPLPTTKSAMYAWFWIARTRPWQEAVAASTIAEWTNDDRLLVTSVAATAADSTGSGRAI